MILGVDINEANVSQRVGVNQVAFELFIHLVSVNTKHHIIAFSKNRPLPDFPPSSNLLSYETFGPNTAWVLTGLTKRLLFGRPKIDCLFSPSHYTPLISITPAVIAIMDLSYERFGTQYFTSYDYNQLKRWTPLSVKKARKIITISQFSKEEIISFYHTKPEKIEIIYPGRNTNLYHAKIPKSKIDKIKKRFAISGKYFIYVGTLQPRKNLIRLIEAFSQLAKPVGPKKLKLVIVGKKGWLYDQIMEKVKKLRIEDSVIFTGFIPNDDLPALLRGSIAYVLPSLYEGFGMPPVEAQSVGTVVVVSRISSLPEVIGESGVYIDDPDSAKNIVSVLNKVLQLKKGEREVLIQKGKDNAKRFDWEESAKKLLLILESVGTHHVS